MNVTVKQERIIRRALAGWQQTGALSPDDEARLGATLEPQLFDWKRLSRYAFWTKLTCVLIAGLAVFLLALGELVWCRNGLYVRQGRILAGDELPGSWCSVAYY